MNSFSNVSNNQLNININHQSSKGGKEQQDPLDKLYSSENSTNYNNNEK